MNHFPECLLIEMDFFQTAFGTCVAGENKMVIGFGWGVGKV